MAIVLVVVLLFGRGKISELMADTAKGIKSFKKGLADDETAEPQKPEPKVIDSTATTTTAKDEPTKVS